MTDTEEGMYYDPNNEAMEVEVQDAVKSVEVLDAVDGWKEEELERLRMTKRSPV